MTNQKHYPDLGRTCHQYGISALFSQTRFCKETSGDVVKIQLFSQGTLQSVYISTPCCKRNEQMKGMKPKTSKMVMCNIRNVVSRKPGAFIINYHLQSIFYNPNGVCKGCPTHKINNNVINMNKHLNLIQLKTIIRYSCQISVYVNFCICNRFVTAHYTYKSDTLTLILFITYRPQQFHFINCSLSIMGSTFHNFQGNKPTISEMQKRIIRALKSEGFVCRCKRVHCIHCS